MTTVTLQLIGRRLEDGGNPEPFTLELDRVPVFGEWIHWADDDWAVSRVEWRPEPHVVAGCVDRRHG